MRRPHAAAPDLEERARQVFLEIWGLPPGERDAALAERCGGDSDLRAAVEELLALSEKAAGLFTAPALRPTHADLIDAAIDGLSLAATPPPTAGILPERIGRYRIIRLIAMGGMGTVYEAVQDAPRRTVAIKLLRADLLSPTTIRRFEYEAEALASLQHPGIAEVYEFGSCRPFGPEQPFFAMELIRGLPITRYADERRLDARARIALMAEVCDAVSHAHQRGIIHRDLKPANILVDESGRPKVVDFGIARPIDHDLGATMNTSPGQILGTLAYMSPEQLAPLEGKGRGVEVDTRADVYALGVVLYELLVGRLPYDPPSGSLLKLVHAIRVGAIDRPGRRGRHPALRGDTGRVVRAAMAPDRNRRYQSVSDLATDLRRLPRNEPILARAPSPLYVAGKFLSRHRLGAASAAAVAIGAGSLLGVSIVRISRAEREATRQYLALRDQVDFLVDDVIDELERISGAGVVNRRVIERLLEHSADSLRRHDADEALLENHARLLGHLANIDQAEYRPQAAMASLRESLALRERLLAARPDDPDRLMELGLTFVRIGDVANQLGDLATTRRMYLHALEIDERLVAAHPHSRRYLDNLGYSYERVGFLAWEENDLEAVRAALIRRLEIAEQVYERFPDNPKSLLGLCSANAQISTLLTQIGETAAAHAHAVRAAEYGDRLMRAEPHHRYYARYAASAHHIAAVSDPARPSPESVAHLREALAIAERMAASAPNEVWPWESIMWTRKVMKEEATLRGDHAEAAEHARAIRDADARLRAMGVTPSPPLAD